jgi:hypothetical protein
MKKAMFLGAAAITFATQTGRTATTSAKNGIPNDG